MEINRKSDFVVYWGQSKITLFIFYIFTQSQGKIAELLATCAYVGFF